MKKVCKALTISLLLLSSNLMGHDLSVTLNGHKIYFNITSEAEKRVEITYCGSIADGQPSWYVGNLTIPAKIRHSNTIYNVTSIGDKAFSGAYELTGVVIPAGVVSIGDFAFEGCTKLNKIVFPDNSVSFGEGVFFKCDKISEVTIGNMWKDVELKMFRWSDSLTSIAIPSSVERIRNMKSLKHLREIYVEADNAKFTSIDGVLYNKAHDVLYGCPRGYEGRLQIAEGTTTITPGALTDCAEVTMIDFPESITTIPFRELRYSQNLARVIFRSPTPVLTATFNGEQLFAIETANPDIEIILPKSAKREYRAIMPVESGEYMEINDSIPYQINICSLVSLDNIVWVKDFSKYENRKTDDETTN